MAGKPRHSHAFYVDRHYGMRATHRREPGDRRSLRPVATVFVILLVLAAVAGGFWLHGRTRSGRVVEAFADALDRKDHAAALALYKEAQVKALDTGFFAFHAERFRNAVRQMEIQAAAETDAILDPLLQSGERLDYLSRSFLENLRELSSARVKVRLREESLAFLDGTRSLARLEPFLREMATVRGLEEAAGSLLAELPALEAAAPDFLEARGLLEAFSWLEAADLLDRLVETSDGFVREAALARYDAAKTRMRGPLLDQVETLVDGFRYYTAHDLLERILLHFPQDADFILQAETCRRLAPQNLVTVTDPVEHLIVRPLILSTEEAFDGDSYARAAEDSMLTRREFSMILEDLYARGYMLIDIRSLVRFEGGVAKAVPVRLPAGRKPLVMTLEAFNYNVFRWMTGNARNLVLTEEGAIAALRGTADGGSSLDPDGDAVGILNRFIDDHPDFSFDGTRGNLSLTGYEGIFGYLTDVDQLDDRNEALAAIGLPPVRPSQADMDEASRQVAALCRRLLDTGWTLSSSTYGFINAGQASEDRVRTDTGKWLAQVGLHTGPTQVLVYPNGSWLKGSDPRCEFLKDEGFRIFVGNGPAAYLTIGADYLYMDAVPLNGHTLRTYDLSRFFDAGRVYDPARPTSRTRSD